MDAKTGKEIADQGALRDLYGDAMGISVAKEIDRLDHHCRAIIAKSPFLCLASSDAEGKADVSPKGDAPGFVRVLDDHHILIPDRPGNNRLDTMENILQNPEVATIFFIPGMKEMLRINGRARIVTDAEVLEDFEVNGKLPKTALLIEVREVFTHCAKALARSRLWDDDYKIDRNELPSLAEILADHADDGSSVEDIAAKIEHSRKTRMY